MSINIIGTLKPKNNGTFPVAEAVDVDVSGRRLPDVLDGKAEKNELAALETAIEGKADAELISNALDAKADTTITDALQAQINAIVTPVSQEAEVENARVGADGTTYSTLKERLDTEKVGHDKADQQIKNDIQFMTGEKYSEILSDNITLAYLQEINAVGTWNDNVYTRDGLTYTVVFNDDVLDYIEVTGEAADDSFFVIMRPITGVNHISARGIYQNVYGEGANLALYTNAGDRLAYTYTVNGVSRDVSPNESYYVGIRIAQNLNLDHFRVFPKVFTGDINASLSYQINMLANELEIISENILEHLTIYDLKKMNAVGEWVGNEYHRDGLVWTVTTNGLGEVLSISANGTVSSEIGGAFTTFIASAGVPVHNRKVSFNGGQAGGTLRTYGAYLYEREDFDRICGSFKGYEEVVETDFYSVDVRIIVYKDKSINDTFHPTISYGVLKREQPDNNILRITSWNLGNYQVDGTSGEIVDPTEQEEKRVSFLRRIAAQKPDVFMAVENRDYFDDARTYSTWEHIYSNAFNDWVDWRSEALAYRRDIYTNYHWRYGSNYVFTNKLPHSYNGFTFGVTRIKGKNIFFASLHLIHNGAEYDPETGDYLDWRGTRIAQVQEMLDAIHRLEGRMPFDAYIIAGDYNTQDMSELQALTDDGYSFANCAAWGNYITHKTYAIDNVAYKGVKLRDVEIVDCLDLSDHQLVNTIFEII